MSLSTLLVLSLALSSAGAQAETPRRDPAQLERGKVLAWTSKEGIPFEYCVPESYDPERGAALTVVLHGNGLDQRWTFWNHPAGKFRKDDVVVSPDGTSPFEGTGANEFLGTEKDAARLRALLEELRAHWNVRQVFLYGHSQGSFFVFYYAGLHPGTIDGVLGHASGVWSHTRLHRDGHRLAIGIMHGTDDHIPYGQGWHGRKTYRGARYPLVHLRTLFDWPHAPHWVQANQVLAWCEGMTSEDPARVAAALEVLSDPKAPLGPDLAALHAVAARLSAMESAPEAARRRAGRIAEAVDGLAAELATRVERGFSKKRVPAVAAEEWLGLAIRLVEELEGVPALETFLAGKGRGLADVRKKADAALAEYWRKRERDPAGALESALTLLEEGWLSHQCPSVAKEVESWLADSRDLKLSKRTQKRAEDLLAAYRKGRELGFRAFTRAAEKLDLPR